MSAQTIILGICGGIAAYKTPEVVRLLVKAGHAVHVVLTKSAEQFVTPLALQTVSGNPVHQTLFPRCHPEHREGSSEHTGSFGLRPQDDPMMHIRLADAATCILVAPATANVLAKVAHGLCDDLLTTILCATKAPVLFAPAMNVHMWENPITQDNVARLKKHGYTIIPPVAGDLACGYEGMGRMPEPAELVAALAKHL